MAYHGLPNAPFVELTRQQFEAVLGDNYQAREAYLNATLATAENAAQASAQQMALGGLGGLGSTSVGQALGIGVLPPAPATNYQALCVIRDLLAELGVQPEPHKGNLGQGIVDALEALVAKRKAEAARHAADRASPSPVRRSNKPAGSRW